MDPWGTEQHGEKEAREYSDGNSPISEVEEYALMSRVFVEDPFILTFFQGRLFKWYEQQRSKAEVRSNKSVACNTIHYFHSFLYFLKKKIQQCTDI